MKSQLRLLTQFNHQNCSFSIEAHPYQFLKVWHYHPEIELVYILESSGKKYIGDCIEQFSPNEIVLLGKNLPHFWLSDPKTYPKGDNSRARALVVYFLENFSETLLKLPEMHSILSLFEKAKYGIKFQGDFNKIILKKLMKIQDTKGLEKFISLIDVLNDLCNHDNYTFLSKASFSDLINKNIKIENKISRVQNYVLNNFQNGIQLEVAAGLSNMNPSAFSRYFKKNQNKTFSQFVNEVRIGHACMLLIEDKYNIAEVCYESGFNNLSNFNRKFKDLKKMSPSEYIKLHKEIN